MDIKKTFLNLTEYTIPHGKENILVKYLPKNINKDQFGNYYLTIGQSDTLFTSHLDTYCKNLKKVNHIIDGNIIKTDGTTILGGDNKSGVVILLYMIENGVPGTYYFFAGEEPTAKDGGLYGSSKALKSNPEYFRKFKRAICFDRKKEGSIITRQMARFTCSEQFVDSLIHEFSKYGLEYRPDKTGYYTDVAVFIDIIPEITNLSNGTYNEHTKEEYVDIDYLTKVANAAIKINWDNLPVVRIPKIETSKDNKKINNRFKNFVLTQKDKKIFNKVDNVLSLYEFRCLNEDEFETDLNMIYSKWFEEERVLIKINNGIIFINDERIGNYKEFEKYLNITLEDKIDIDNFINTIKMVSEHIGSKNIDFELLNDIFEHFGINIDEFEEYYNQPNCVLKKHMIYNIDNKSINLI